MKKRKLIRAISTVAIAMAVTVAGLPAMSGSSTVVNAKSKATEVSKNSSKSVKFKSGKTFKVKIKNVKVKGTAFKSSSKKIATVNKKGKVTLKGIGKSTITMKNSKARKTVKLKVVSYGLKSVPVILGKNCSYKVKGISPKGSGTFKMKAQKSGFVNIKGTTIKANSKEGNVKIDVFYKNKGKNIKFSSFTVNCRKEKQGVTRKSVTVSKEFPYIIQAWDKYGHTSKDGKFKFKVISGASVVKVDKYGKVTANKDDGTAVVEVKSGNSKLGEVTVNAKKFNIVVTNPDGTKAKIGKLGSGKYTGKNAIRYLYKYNSYLLYAAKYDKTDETYPNESPLHAYLGNFFKNVSGYYTCELKTPKNFTCNKWKTLKKLGGGWVYLETPSFNQTCGTVSIEGIDNPSVKVDYDYDSEYKHQTVSYLNKYGIEFFADRDLLYAKQKNNLTQGYAATSYINSRGLIYGGSVNESLGAGNETKYPSSNDVCLSKIKVGSKYYIIEFVFNRKEVEKGYTDWDTSDRVWKGLVVDGYLHPTVYQMKAHDKVLGVPDDDFLKIVRSDKDYEKLALLNTYHQALGGYGYCPKHGKKIDNHLFNDAEDIRIVSKTGHYYLADSDSGILQCYNGLTAKEFYEDNLKFVNENNKVIPNYILNLYY